MLSIHEAPLGRSLAAASLGAVLGATALVNYYEQPHPTIEVQASSVNPQQFGELAVNQCALSPGACIEPSWQKSIASLDLTHIPHHASRSRRPYPTDGQLFELAGCESNHDPKYGGPGGHVDKGYEQYEGLYNFANGTWRRWKPASYPPHAYQATEAQQDTVARTTWRHEGWSAWPSCSVTLGFA